MAAHRPPRRHILRQLSDAADPDRTYEARYVLDGEASRAPLGATVTVSVATGGTTEATEVPLGALYDDGKSSSVWVVDPHVVRLIEGRAGSPARRGDRRRCSGVESGERIVALGAHLLHQGERVRLADDPECRPMTRFNLSALAVRERSITLFLILVIAVAAAPTRS